ncbi:MAG: hypothetical protein RLZZ435_2712 [Cyanobacteriota bacterium]|jgi:hypothetical protein
MRKNSRPSQALVIDFDRNDRTQQPKLRLETLS